MAIDPRKSVDTAIASLRLKEAILVRELRIVREGIQALTRVTSAEADEYDPGMSIINAAIRVLDDVKQWMRAKSIYPLAQRIGCTAAPDSFSSALHREASAEEPRIVKHRHRKGFFGLPGFVDKP